MAIARHNNLNTLTGVVRQDLEDPRGDLVWAPAMRQYSIHNLPSKLQGLDIPRTLKVVNRIISDRVFELASDSFKDQIKKEMCMWIADEVYKVMKFTRIEDHTSCNHTIIGRVVIMTEDQLNKLIQAAG